MMASWVGRCLIKRRNFFVNKVVPMAVGRKDVLTRQVVEHYRNAQSTPDLRSASAARPGAGVGETDRFRSIWSDREAFTRMPTLVLWGMRDIAFRRKEPERWKSELADFELHEFEDCGHFLAEECPERVLAALSPFMRRT